MDSNPIHHLSPAKEWNAHFWITFNFWWLARLVDGLKPHLLPLSSQKNEMLVFGLCSTFDDWPGWSMHSNPIHNPSPTKKMKCLFLDYVQLLMISQVGRWTQTPSATPLQPKKWNACFWIMFNFWWLARLVNGLKPHPQSLSNQKNEMLVFELCSTSDDWPGWSMDSNSICYPSPTKKMKCLFLDYVQLLMIGQAGKWTRTPSATPLQPKKWNACFWIMFNFWRLARLVDGCKSHLAALSSQKNKNLIFGLCSTSDDQLGWLKDSNLICHPSPTKKWNTCFCITFNFWWWAWLLDGLKPHLPTFSSQIMKCSFLDYAQLLMISWAGWWTRTPSATSLQPKKWNAHFCIMFNFWWSARLVNGLEPHVPPLSRHKMKCLFLDYIQLLMIGCDGRWTQTPCTTPLQPKKWNAHFWITFNFWWSAGLVNGFKPHPPPISSQKNEMPIFGLLSISGDQPGWSLDSNPIHLPCQAKKKWNAHFWITFTFWWSARLVDGLKPHLPPLSRHKIKCSFLHYVQLVMIGRAGQWTQTPSATLLQPKKWNAHFCIMFNFWWSAGLVDGLKSHPLPFPSQKNEMLIFVLHSTSDDWPGWSLYLNPIHLLSQAKKMKCSFFDYFQFLAISQAGQWTQTPSTTPLQPKNEMLIFGLCSTSDDQLGSSMDSNPICNLSPAKKVKCSFLDYVQLLMIGRPGQWTRTPSATSLQPKNEMLIFGLHSTSDD